MHPKKLAKRALVRGWQTALQTFFALSFASWATYRRAGKYYFQVFVLLRLFIFMTTFVTFTPYKFNANICIFYYLDFQNRLVVFSLMHEEKY